MLKTGLRSCTAMAVVVSCSSDLTPSLGISICHGFGPKKSDRQTDRQTETEISLLNCILPSSGSIMVSGRSVGSMFGEEGRWQSEEGFVS